jgi:hypothetical protein
MVEHSAAGLMEGAAEDRGSEEEVEMAGAWAATGVAAVHRIKLSCTLDCCHNCIRFRHIEDRYCHTFEARSWNI